MKQPLKLALILIGMFLIAQLIGIAVSSYYSPKIEQITYQNGTQANITSYDLPYGTSPPEGVTAGSALVSIVISMAIAIALILILMKYKTALLLRYWFLIVIILGMGITINAVIHKVPYASLIAIIIAIPLAVLKVFKRNMIVHNLTELMVYPGIAAIFIPLLNIYVAVILIVLICIYDMWAVWHVGFMQKMAKYQINEVKVFGGFVVPYLDKKNKLILEKLKKLNEKSKTKLKKKIKINMAILGGGDIVFPLILAGTVLHSLGLTQAIIIAIGSTLGLTGLLFFSDKGKFYPAMPFISAGALIALVLVYIL